MVESVCNGFPKNLLPTDRIAAYPVVAATLIFEAISLLLCAAMLIRFGGGAQQGVYGDQSSVVDMLIRGNWLVVIQAAMNASALLAHGFIAPYGPMIVSVSVLVAILLMFISLKRLIELGLELRR